MRLQLPAERWIPACSSGQLWCSEHWVSILVQDSIQCNGWDCRLALLWQLLVHSEIAFSKLELASRFVLHALWGLDIGGYQISSVYDLSRTSGMRWAGDCRSPIEPLGRDWQSVTNWAAEQRLSFRFYIFELSWWKSVHIIYFKIRFLAAETYILVKM